MWCQMSGRAARCLRNSLGLRLPQTGGGPRRSTWARVPMGPHNQQLRVFSEEIPTRCSPTPPWAQGGCQPGRPLCRRPPFAQLLAHLHHLAGPGGA